MNTNRNTNVCKLSWVTFKSGLFDDYRIERCQIIKISYDVSLFIVLILCKHF